MKRSAPVVVRKSAVGHQPRPGFAAILKRAAAAQIEKAITPQQQGDAILAIADKYDTKIRREIVAAWATMKSSVKISELASLIEQGAPDYLIFQALGVDSWKAQMGSTLDQLSNAAVEAGTATVQQVSDGITGFPRLNVYFDRNSPVMVEQLREQAAQLVTAISDDVKLNIRERLADMAAGAEGTPVSAARAMRDMIGLTQRQQQAVDNYRNYLLNGDPRAYARNIGGGAERIIGAAFRDGTMTAAKADKLVEAYRQRSLQSRATIIGQTESFRAANAGAHESWKQVAEASGIDPDQIRRFWVATNDSHTREAHREIPEINDKGVRIDQPFKSPLGPIMYPGDPDAVPANTINCFHPETIIEGNIDAAIRSFYEGPMFEIRTRLGRVLNVTPNHPIATRIGMQQASLLQLGDDLLCDSRAVKSGFTVAGEENDAPAKAHEVFDLISKIGAGFEAQGLVFNLHNESISRERKIDIVTLNRELAGKLEAIIAQRGQQSHFSVSDMGLTDESGFSALRLAFNHIDLSAPSLLRCGSLQTDFIGIALDSLPFDEFLFASRPKRGSGVAKKIGHDLTGYAAFLGKLFDRSPGQVFFDDVVSVRQYDFAGHVYDFQSDTGLVIANGIVSSNCRCRIVIRIAGTPTGFLPPMIAGRSILPSGSR